jgi:hypothetical protein
MANEILVSYISGKTTLTASIYYDDNGDITERETGIALQEQPSSSGMYKGSPTTIASNDTIQIYEGTILIGSDQYLADTGKPDLDSVSIVEPSGVASNFREMAIQLWIRFFNKVDKTSTEIKTYDASGNVITTQTYTESGDTEIVNKAS